MLVVVVLTIIRITEDHSSTEMILNSFRTEEVDTLSYMMVVLLLISRMSSSSLQLPLEKEENREDSNREIEKSTFHMVLIREMVPNLIIKKVQELVLLTSQERDKISTTTEFNIKITIINTLHIIILSNSTINTKSKISKKEDSTTTATMLT